MQYISGWKKSKKKKKPSKARIAKGKAKGIAKVMNRYAKELRDNMTPAELKLWEHLKTWKEPYLCEAQYVIGKRIADFAFIKQKIVIEIDGKDHLNPIKRADDYRRTKEMKRAGYLTIRFTNDEVFADIDTVLEAIKVGLKPSKPKPFKCSLLLADWSRPD